MNIDLSEIDTVIISHGLNDHGGALRSFLQVNTKAKIYVQRSAFKRHYSKFLFFLVNIGLDDSLEIHPQVILVDGNMKNDDELSLYIVDNDSKWYSNANDLLYEGHHKDHLRHEQTLVVREDRTAVIIGCGYSGIVNIMDKAASYNPQVCVGGYHLFNPLTKIQLISVYWKK